MTFAYLVDTDWAIHWLHGNKRVQRRIEALHGQGLALSAISLAELRSSPITAAILKISKTCGSKVFCSQY